MIKKYLCLNCEKASVCKIADILGKFDDNVKNPLGVNITIDQCSHYLVDDIKEDLIEDDE